MKAINFNHTIRELKKELTYLMLHKKINIKTYERYLSLAVKIFTDREYLKQVFSKGHMRRIKRVFKLIERIIPIRIRNTNDLAYRLKSGVFSFGTNMIFSNIKNYFKYKDKAVRIQKELDLFLKLEF